jgi:hypothetical protein
MYYTEDVVCINHHGGRSERWEQQRFASCLSLYEAPRNADGAVLKGPSNEGTVSAFRLAPPTFAEA